MKKILCHLLAILLCQGVLLAGSPTFYNILEYGVLPAWGLFVRYARRISFRDVRIETIEPDTRPAIVLMDAEDIHFDGLSISNAASAPAFELRGVRNLQVSGSSSLKDLRIKHADNKTIR